MEHEAANPMQLPVQVISRVDISRLIRELDALEDYLAQSSIRKTEGGAVLPRTSHLLEEFAGSNNLNFLRAEDRQKAKNFLKSLQSSAPQIHISFASNPSAAFTRQVLTWFRNNIHQYTLLNIGLEPGIAAGCIVRTTNRQFDFSLRQHFKDNEKILSEMITGQGANVG